MNIQKDLLREAEDILINQKLARSSMEHVSKTNNNRGMSYHWNFSFFFVPERIVIR